MQLGSTFTVCKRKAAEAKAERVRSATLDGFASWSDELVRHRYAHYLVFSVFFFFFFFSQS
jgi:hypothetical protein